MQCAEYCPARLQPEAGETEGIELLAGLLKSLIAGRSRDSLITGWTGYERKAIAHSA